MRSPAPDPGGAEPRRDAVRDAATIILKRVVDGVPALLMGQRGAGAAFMPNKFVFPGGALDPDDIGLSQDGPLDPRTAERLAAGTAPDIARALPFTAVRETWEETGIMLARKARSRPGPDVPESWRDFYEKGLEPDVSGLHLVFRAITPPGRPRRFDARFFLLDMAEDRAGGEILTGGDGELSHLQWLTIPEARKLPLPFITGVVLAELEARFREPGRDHAVPFFDQTPDGSRFRML